MVSFVSSTRVKLCTGNLQKLTHERSGFNPPFNRTRYERAFL